MLPVSLSILIVNHNTRDMTRACIRSVLDQTVRTQFEVVIVDNASSDGSGEAIAKEFPEVRLISARYNEGFGRANNIAAKNATGEFLLLLNPDTLILKNAIDRLVQFAAANPHSGIWGGRTVFPDGSINPKSCWRFVSLWSLFTQAIGLSALRGESERFNYEEYGGWTRDSVREVDFIAGCFLLVRREIWEELGGFDERFFMYAEEADLCYRARQRGARPLFTPDATIIHYGGASEPARAPKIQKLFAGKLTFIAKHWSRPSAVVARYLLELHSFTRMVGYGILARIMGAGNYHKAAQEWRDVWRAREEWIYGYKGNRPAGRRCRQV